MQIRLIQDPYFARDLEDSKSTSDGTLCILGCHTLVPISWICKKQISVSHSSTKLEVTSVYAGLRLDEGIAGVIGISNFFRAFITFFLNSFSSGSMKNSS